MKDNKILYTIVLVIFSLNCFSQIVVDNSTGCVPLIVQFDYNSSASLTSIYWNFDDGASSSLQSCAHTFSTVGTYNVTFSALDGTNTINDNIIINVYGNPVAQFTADTTSGCVGLEVNFQDMSVGGGGTSIISWEWSFGDGGTDTIVPDPSYIFNLPGSFNVSLIIFDENGCDSSVTYQNYITISLPPEAIINTDPENTIVCVPPLDVSFSAQDSYSNSTTGTGLTYYWDFGNGNTSVEENPPAQNYDSFGSFTVTLLVYDDNGCPDSANVDVIIDNPTASFTANDTLCEGVPAYFTNTSTPGTAYWNYGDGTSGPSSTHVYHQDDLYVYYDVTLTITVQDDTIICTDDTTISVLVENVIADFIIDPSFICNLPQDVAFINQSSYNAVDFYWNFGIDTLPDGIYSGLYHGTLTESDEENPVNNYFLTDTIHSINTQVVFEDCLTVTTAAGCTDMECHNDTVFVPNALFMPDFVDGCVPLNVIFSDSSTAPGDIISWEWDFGGDGTGNQQNPQHIFSSPGQYDVILIITDSHGCSDTSYAVTISVGEEQLPQFEITPVVTCPDQPVQFTDLTQDTITDAWHFETDNNHMWACPGDSAPVWNFNSEAGLHDITFTIGNYDCFSEITIPDAIEILGPVAHIIEYSMCCDSPFVYTFAGEISGADSLIWNFGDDSVSTELNPVHIYDSTVSDDYIVTLTAFNDSTGCPPYIDTVIINVRNIKAAFAFDSLLCAREDYIFDASPSEDVYEYCHRGYFWDFGDGTRPTRKDSPFIQHTFDQDAVGGNVVTLVTTDINGCTDTITDTVYVYDVYPDIYADPLYGCLPLHVIFIDSSTYDYGSGLAEWDWQFGDGSTSNAQDTVYDYTDAPNPPFWNVILTITDSLGCSDSTTITITPSIPVSSFYADPYIDFCQGDSVQFIAINNDTSATFTWQIEDSVIQDTGKIIWYTFDTSGTFTITLTVTDSIGCADTSSISDYIYVQAAPQAGFSTTIDTLQVICYPEHIEFTDTSIVEGFIERIWDLGTGGPIITDPVVGYNYELPGTYDIMLVINTAAGCSDTAWKTITLVGPVADFEMSTNFVCIGEDITFNIIDTVDVFYYEWDFGDGIIESVVSPVIHTYDHHPENGQTLVQLTIWSEGMTCPMTIPQDVYIHQVIADFNRNNETDVTDTAHCIGITDYFTNLSINADNWIWNFGDGSPQYTGQSPPSHTYNEADTFYIELYISDSETGCEDMIIKPMIIFPAPELTAAGGDTCFGDSIQIFAFGEGSFEWSPSDGLSNTNIPDPIASPSSTTIYTIFITDSNNCQNSTSVQVYIQQAADQTYWDTTVIIGETVQLNAYAGEGFTYIWSPPDSLSCINCPYPVSNILQDMNYIVLLEDTLGCFSITSYYDIYVDSLYNIDVPSAFTPNGDGHNDIVYVKGWGIKKLLEFKIFNRWGQIVYYSDDINQGWDGTYKGKRQNMDAYVYMVKVEMHSSQIVTKQGYINLLR